MNTSEATKSKNSLSFELAQSKSKIIEKLEGKIKNHKFSLFASELSANYIHYPFFKIEKERIVVRRGRAGTIYIYLEEVPGGKTRLRVELEKFGSRAKTALLILSVVMFSLVFYFNYTMGDSIGSALVVTLIPFVFGVVFFLLFVFLMGKLQKHFFTTFANKIARVLEGDE